MERKIGEIFEHNGEWYQCLKSKGACSGCTAFGKNYSFCRSFGECTGDTIFKKLKKVGKPYDFQKRTFQTYKLHTIPFLSEDVELVAIPSKDNNTIEVEIKQTKKDMEETNKQIEQAKIYSVIGKYLDDKLSFNDFAKEIETILFANKEESKPTLKEFDLEAAKKGKPVCTRDGRKARIICFDAEGNKPLIVLSRINGQEVILRYTEKGQSDNFHSPTPREDDLMMLPEKKEGWAVIRKGDIYETEEQAKKVLLDSRIGVMIRKVGWEE